LELAHAFVDFSGYDLVASCGAVTRHIQLKATAGKVVLHRALASKPSGCCVLLTRSVTASDESSPRIIMNYRFLGGSPNEPLVIDPAWRAARGTRFARTPDGEFARPERTNHVDVPRSAFGPTLEVDGLVTALFGKEIENRSDRP
jgi:hypothetical protein